MQLDCLFNSLFRIRTKKASKAPHHNWPEPVRACFVFQVLAFLFNILNTKKTSVFCITGLLWGNQSGHLWLSSTQDFNAYIFYWKSHATICFNSLFRLKRNCWTNSRVASHVGLNLCINYHLGTEITIDWCNTKFDTASGSTTCDAIRLFVQQFVQDKNKESIKSSTS